MFRTAVLRCQEETLLIRIIICGQSRFPARCKKIIHRRFLGHLQINLFVTRSDRDRGFLARFYTDSKLGKLCRTGNLGFLSRSIRDLTKFASGHKLRACKLLHLHLVRAVSCDASRGCSLHLRLVRGRNLPGLETSLKSCL